MFPYWSQLDEMLMEQEQDKQHRLIALQFKYARTDIRKHSFAVRVVEGWNRLPDQVKMTASKNERPLVRRKMMDQRESKEQNS
jgi:hypothetical protein